jgi:sugar phosphate isomerase/epimerase/predicted metal-dependent hydrolase
VDIPQDDAIGNILPFPQRFQPRPGAEGSTPDSPDPDDFVTGTSPVSGDADRILSIEDVLQPLPMDDPRISHLRSLPLGISSGALYPHTHTEDVPAAARRLGVTDVELMLQSAGEYQPSFARLLHRNAVDAGVRVHSVHSMHRLHRMQVPYERRRREERELFRRAIELTATVGASVLVWHGIDRAMHRSDDDWERFIELTGELTAECAEAGIILGLENVSSCILATVRDVARFATRLGEIGGKDRVGFVFDPFQAVEAGANPFMVLAAMGNRVVNVHISDASESNLAARHLPPGDGDLPWSALLRAIAGSGYRGPLMIEGPLGTDDRTMTRIRETFDPLFRNVFSFPPEGIVEELPPTDVDDWALRSEPPAGVSKGIDLFNARQFYEQHEEIEHEWHAERGPLRRLYQGLLQVGVGFHHALHGNYRGAVLLLTQGIEKVEAFTPRALGIDTARFVTESRTALDQITALGETRLPEFDPESIPTIHFSS